MRKLIIMLIGIVMFSDLSLYSQLMYLPDTLDIPQVVVTANRNSRSLDDIPGRVTVIDANDTGA